MFHGTHVFRCGSDMGIPISELILGIGGSPAEHALNSRARPLPPFLLLTLPRFARLSLAHSGAAWTGPLSRSPFEVFPLTSYRAGDARGRYGCADRSSDPRTVAVREYD
jgi:hypothetical protein